METSLPTFPPDADFSDLDGVARALTAAVPDAKPIRPLCVLGVGYYSLAVETASDYVFLLGCTEQVTPRHEKEARLLQWLQGYLPVAIPHPRWRIPPGDAFPHGAIGYPKLLGRLLTADVFEQIDRDLLAKDLASFLLALHATPLSDALNHGASPLSDRRPDLERLRETMLAILRPRLSRSCYGCVAAWWERFLGDPLMGDFAPALIHYDVGGQNLLVDDSGRLTGVLDWEHCAAGDPAHDFRQLRAFGAEFQNVALAAYTALGGRLQGDFQERLHRYWQHSFWSIQMAARGGDEDLLTEHIEKMRRRLDC